MHADNADVAERAKTRCSSTGLIGDVQEVAREKVVQNLCMNISSSNLIIYQMQIFH
jgi:hypothetical protein